MKKAIFSLTVAAACAAGAVPAGAAVITFEGYSAGTVFTTQNFGNGVTFAGAQVLQLGTNLNPQFPPHSGSNVVYNPSGPMTLTFLTPVDFFSGYFTYNSGLTIRAFDSLNNQITSTTALCSGNYVGSGCGSPNEFLSVNAAGLIASVVITGGSGNNFTLDDANFTGAINASVPEPAPLMLLGAGVGLLVLARRRRLAL